ncbi:MAG: XRE family transcriptional regulator, partial [Betaproteobacteria bacterium]|nr:XRE family transcriptional regulator [Betaproteobacteria bacterium]
MHKRQLGAVLDTDWFRDRLKERKLSQRGLAKLLELDPGALSLTLRGLRKLTTEEAHAIATVLN